MLSTIQMINDLVKSVGGDYVDSLTLIQGELDPHSYQLVKGDDEKLSFADLIFYNGLGLEHGPSLQHYLETHKKAIGLGNYIKKEYPGLILTHQGQLDPHVWMDISLWSKTVPLIVETLSQKDPAHQKIYEERGQALINEMLKVHKQVGDLLQEIPEKKRYLVTSHDAFSYFTRAYLATPEDLVRGEWQERFQAPEGLAPESQLSPHDIRLIIQHLQQFHINVLFPESNVSKDSIQKIVSAGNEKGLHLHISKEPLYGDAMGSPGSDGDTYLKMILSDARIIQSELLKNGASQNDKTR